MRTIFLLLLASSSALAEIPRNPYITQAEYDLALAVARVAANEASLSTIRPADVGLIWQTTQGHGDTHEERLDWLRRHSSCVLGMQPLNARQLRTNCPWSRNLREDFEEPSGWPSDLTWDAPTRTFIGYRATWRLVYDEALQHVLGITRRRLPCVQTPFSWGGYWDHEGSLSRGLVPIVCHNTINVGYVPRRALRGRPGVHASRARSRTLRGRW